MGSDRPAIVTRPIVTRGELEAVSDPRLRASLLRLYDQMHRRRPPAPDETDRRQPRLPYKEEEDQ